MNPIGFANTYVLTFGDKRLLISGDTGSTPELRAAANIDVAFLCMNLPYTMSVPDAVNVTTEMVPKVVYPYHYQNTLTTSIRG